MTTNDRITRAAEHIDAVELPSGRWAHYSDETDTYWVVDSSELEELCDLLADDDPAVSGDAYSHWCAGYPGHEMPQGWTTDDAEPALPAHPPTVEVWHIAPEDQGQMMEIAYGTDEDCQPWRRVRDLSAGTTSYTAGEWVDGDEWAPWNAAPSSSCVAWRS